MNVQLLARLAARYQKQHLLQIVDLLDRKGGFSFAGQVALVQTLCEVSEYDDHLPLEAVLQECEVAWGTTWAKQDPPVRGNPSAQGEEGIRNTVALENFYVACGVWDSFLQGIPLKIPKTSFGAVTLSGVYVFGVADFNGLRSISCDAAELGFEYGVLQQLALGKSIQLIHEGPGWRMLWYSSPLFSIAS